MMASACVNNPIGMVPTSAADHAFGWLSPRISFSGGNSEPSPNHHEPDSDLPPGQDPDFIDFEFRLHDPVAMLPADELFSGGKLVPLHLPKPAPALSDPGAPLPPQPTQMKQSRREELIGSGSGSLSDIFAVSPKAPTCTSRWRELLRLRKQQQQQSVTTHKPEPVSRNPNPNIRSSAVKQFLHRRSSLGADPNLNLPLLLESEPEAFSRLSLSSLSTSSEEISRLSLDSDLKPKQNPILLNRNPSRARISSSSAAGARVGRTPARRSADAPTPRCASVDSPRMNAWGKVVFHGLGRSSSSPSTFNGGPVRHKYRGMEYSNNVRVINVPVPSKAGLVFGFLGSGSKNVSSSNAAAALKGKN